MKRITKKGEVAVAADAGRISNASVLPLGGLVANDLVKSGVPEEYPFRLNPYLVPPNYDMTIEQFEEYAFARLQSSPPPCRVALTRCAS